MDTKRLLGRTDVQMIWDTDWTIIVQTNRTPPPATALSNEIIGYLTQSPMSCAEPLVAGD